MSILCMLLMLEWVQGLLIKKVNRARQPKKHDVTYLSTLRSWLNFTWGKSMEYEIYKATNTIEGFFKVRIDFLLREFPRYLLIVAFGVDYESHAFAISLIYFP